MSNEFNQFKPTETWSLNDQLDEALSRTVYEMNQIDHGLLINDLRAKVRTAGNGVVYAVLKGEEPSEYSDSEAMVMFNPFALTATDSMLIRSEFIRRLAKRSNIRDSKGNLVPVIMLASPGADGSQFGLSTQERRRIRKGEFGPMASEYLSTVSELGVGLVSLLGFSQGADMAMDGSLLAHSANLDLRAVSVGDPARIENRGPAKLLLDFAFRPGSVNQRPSIERAGLSVQKHASSYEGKLAFLRSAKYPLNISLYKGLSADGFATRIQEIMDGSAIDRFVVGYGSKSTITKPEKIEPILSSMHEQFGHDSFMSVRIDGGNHTWGDQVTLLAKLYMRALV